MNENNKVTFRYTTEVEYQDEYNRLLEQRFKVEKELFETKQVLIESSLLLQDIHQKNYRKKLRLLIKHLGYTLLQILLSILIIINLFTSFNAVFIMAGLAGMMTILGISWKIGMHDYAEIDEDKERLEINRAKINLEDFKNLEKQLKLIRKELNELTIELRQFLTRNQELEVDISIEYDNQLRGNDEQREEKSKNLIKEKKRNGKY